MCIYMVELFYPRSPSSVQTAKINIYHKHWDFDMESDHIKNIILDGTCFIITKIVD